MENFPINIDMYTTVTGLLLPLLISTLVSPEWNKQTKGWVAFGLVFLAAAGHLFFIGTFDIANFPATLLKILFLTAGSYLSFWKPTGVKDAIEKNIGIKPKKAGAYGESGFASTICLMTLAVLTALIMATPALAQDVTLAWDANTETDLAGYKIYYKVAQGGEPYDGTGIIEGGSPIDVGNVTEFKLTGLDLKNNNYFFVATAYNTSGFESGFSNEVTTTPPGIPQGIKVKVTVEVIVN